LKRTVRPGGFVIPNDSKIEVFVEPDLRGRVVMIVQGALDLTEVPVFREVFERVAATDCPDVVVDLDGVTFVGSSGLGLLLQAHNDLEAVGRTFVVRGVGPAIRKAFEITHLDHLLEVEDDPTQPADEPVEPAGS
jgi:anti-anti-sigma factor